MATLKQALKKQGHSGSLRPGYKKYHNSITEVDGIKFHSKKEAEAYRKLNSLLKMGMIQKLECQVKIPLGFSNDRGREYTYVCDFKTIDAMGKEKYIEVKGLDIPLGKMKRHCAEMRLGVKVEVW